MLLDTREHVAEFNSSGPALAIGDDELRARVRDTTLRFDSARQARLAARVFDKDHDALRALADRDGI